MKMDFLSFHPTHPVSDQAKEKKGKPEKGKDKARPKEKKGTKGARKADKGLLAQRRLEERQRQQLILEEMKKPTEDMCLGDHQVGCAGGLRKVTLGRCQLALTPPFSP